jgi:acetyl-CoA C-acetyltransferase
MREAWIIDGVRTPRGKGKPTGALYSLHPQELLAQALNALVGRVGFDPADVDDVIAGNASNEGDHGACIGRLSMLTAGWPYESPGMTVHRHCGSGQQAITFGAMGILAGHQDLVVGGGVESMSHFLPTDVPNAIDGNNAHLRERYSTVPQGISADIIATLEGFSREAVDRFAAESQRRAAVATDEGRFDRSIVPVRHLDGTLALDRDEHPRRGTTVDSLGSLPPAFAEMGETVFAPFGRPFDDMALEAYPQLDRVEHVHHAGNSSGVVDGAAAVLLASSDYARVHGLEPRARILMSAAAGAEPVIMLTAPGPAAQRCLDKAGMKVGDVDLWEINEAFAAVPLKTMRDLELDHEKVNVNGGAIALGHPIGATGAMLIQTVLDELERRDLSTGLVTMCTGGGMGTATIIERV